MTIVRSGRSAMIILVTAVLAACGDSPVPPNTVPPASEAARLVRTHASGCPTKRCIIVGSQPGYKYKPLASVLFYARKANGNVAPAGEISGSKTQLGFPAGLAMDSRASVYVANTYPGSITVYAAGSTGNVVPIRTIAGAKTKLDHPTGITIDSNDELYVANNPNHANGCITVYTSNANGDVMPIRQICGKKTNLFAPWGLALDSQSNLYVANDDPNTGWITVYSPSAHGNSAPIRTIQGSATELAGPTGLAVDASGYVYVENSASVNNDVAIFAPGASGNVSPVSYFSGGYAAYGLTLDGSDIYVTSVGADDEPFVATFRGGALGNQGHVLRKIQGQKTELIFPEGIVVR